MSRHTRRDILFALGSLGGLGAVNLALGRAHTATPNSAAGQRITRFEVIPVRVPMHDRVREVFAEVYRKQ